ncbi:hypothetical protein [Streptomyces sp. NPDC002851]
MSADEAPGGARPADAEGKPADPAAPGAEPPESGAAEDQQAPDDADRPQDAWAARRDLYQHSPKIMVGDGAGFGGGFVARDQHGVSGGQVTGDVIMGSKTEIYHLGVPGPTHASGEVPESVLARLERSFVADESVLDGLLARLRAERVLVLSGAHFTGRRTAALMLLRRLGASPVRTLDRTTSPNALAGQLDGDTGGGYVLCDLSTRRDQPLREPHLLAIREKLAEKDAHLVITVGPTAALEDIPVTRWVPPGAADVLTAQLHAETDEKTVERLLALDSVADFLGRDHQLREVAAFARTLLRYADGAAGEADVARFSLASLESQVQEWFDADEAITPLRDKAFLVALAAFDGAPYALTAELSDALYAYLQETENRLKVPEVPVFGTSIAGRLQLARATSYEETEDTEWGHVTQSKAAYQDDRAALVLLREVWIGHPSARPGLVRWLRLLAGDGRPLVRTRAAATVAVLAATDLPSAMALVVEPWVHSERFRHRNAAVNALALTHMLGSSANVPRILDTWCTDDDPRRCWVAVRAHALIGPERPRETLAALRRAVRKEYGADASDQPVGPDGPDETMLAELADSVELLLLSPAAGEVLAELTRTLDDDRAVHDLALGGFLRACGRTETENDEPYGLPLLLSRYAESAAAGTPDARHIATLWRAALGDRQHTGHALDVLRDWVLSADRDQAVEWQLAALLPELAEPGPARQRLGHLLRTMPGEDGSPPPRVAERLLTVLPGERAPA